MNTLRTKYRHTIYASYIGYITQAIVNNFVPLLFLTFQSLFNVSLDQIVMLVSLNFGVQLCTDIVAVKLVDHIGYRKSAVSAHLCCGIGIIGLAVFPSLFPSPFLGLCFAVILYAIGGGLIEVIISPIVESCPSDNKEAAMSLLHSFYCWGHVFVVLMSTIFFFTIGIEHWTYLACLWAIVPLANSIYFMFVPLNALVESSQGMGIRGIFKEKIFWILCILMICAAGSEQSMSQWASAFSESALGISKSVGDLAGPLTFAMCMGCARLYFGKYSEKINLERFMKYSCALCIFAYLLTALAPHPVLSLLGCAICGFSVGIMWPGAISIAAKTLRKGGTALFAMLALAGDFGCVIGPGVVGMVSDAFSSDLRVGILVATIFPILLMMGLFVCRRLSKAEEVKGLDLERV